MDVEHPLVLFDVLEHLPHLTARHVEDLDAHVPSARCQQRPIIAEGDALERLDSGIEAAGRSGGAQIEEGDLRLVAHRYPVTARIERGDVSAANVANQLPIGTANNPGPGKDDLAVTAQCHRRTERL